MVRAEKEGSQVAQKGPTNVVPKDLAGVVLKGPTSIKVKADKM